MKRNLERQMVHDVRSLLQTTQATAYFLKENLPEGMEEEFAMLDRLLNNTNNVNQLLQQYDKETCMTVPSLKIVVAEDDKTTRLYIKRILTKNGHQVVGEASNGNALISVCLETKPDLLVCDIHLPGKEGLDAINKLAEKMSVVAVAVTGDNDAALVNKALANHVMAYLLKPITPEQLIASLGVAWARHKEINILKEAAQVSHGFPARFTVEKAKTLLMRRHCLTEQESFAQLQRKALDRRVSIIRISEEVIQSKAI